MQRLKKHINLARLVSRLALSSFKKGLVHVTFESITLLCHHQTHLLVTSKEKKKTCCVCFGLISLLCNELNETLGHAGNDNGS